MRAEAETRGGAFSFALLYDGGALASCAATAGCNLTGQAISDLTYAYNSYENSPAYMRVHGRPVVFFFDPDRYGSLNWATVIASVPGNPLLVFRNAAGFTHDQSGGSFSWVGLNVSAPSDMGLGYFDYFYQTSLSYPQALTVGSGNKGFNDSLAAWSPASGARIQAQHCGETWLNTLAQAGNYFSSAKQLDALQLVTWNDYYEEGTEIETGIDNCISIAASLTGSQLSWTATGNPATVDHFTVFISADGQNLMSLGDLPASARSLDLSVAQMAAGNYTVFVKAVGKPSLSNKMSAGVAYNVAGTPPPPPTPNPTSTALVVSPPAQTIAQGETATYQVSVAGFSSAASISFSCSNLPPDAACSFSPASMASGNTINATLTISTRTASARLNLRENEQPAVAALLALSNVGLAALAMLPRRRRKGPLWLIGLGILVALVLTQLGCAGGVYRPNASVGSLTPSGTYAVTVTATAGSVQNSTSVMLVVK